MAARAQRLIVLAAIVAGCFVSFGSPARAALGDRALDQAGAAQPRPAQTPKRIVSLVPALTEMLFAIGAGSQVAAVSSFDEFPPEVKRLPRVGALLDPDTERILALRPDLVVIYGSQTDLQSQFARVSVPTFVYRHGGIDTILESIRDLGAATGHDAAAVTLVGELQGRLQQVRARVKGRARPRVLLVFERQPRTLREVYASGGRGFLHEMLDIAGGQNVFADMARESVQPSTETILARAPEIILEVRAEGLIAARDVANEREVWATLSSVPAVRDKRIHFLSGDYLVVPGPRFAQATEALAKVLHPDAFR